MTTLSITADLAKKRLKVEGRVAAGEKVAVTVKGFGDKSVSNTRLRVMFAEKVVAIFPLPNAETGWTKDGEDLTGVLNLNTVQAERITQCGSMVCFWVLDDVSDEVRQLYGTAEHELLKWVKRPDTDVPVDLDSFPTLIEEMQQAIATFKSEIRGEWTNYQQTLSAAWTQYRDSLAELYSQFTNNVSSLVNGKASAQDLNAHTGNKSNPHEVTKAQVGLGNVDNTKDVDKPVSSQQQTAINSAKEQVASLVQSEARRATGKEQELQNGIDAEGRRASSVESNLELAIRTEKARAEGVESNLNLAVRTEKDRAEGAEAALGSAKQDKLSSQQLAAVNSGIDASKVAKIAQNESAILAEVSRATTEEARLQALINAIKTFEVVVADSLPSPASQYSKKLYLIPSTNPEARNVRDEFICVLFGGTWKWEHVGSTAITIEFDDEPTEGSQKAARSGGIWAWVKRLVTGKLAAKPLPKYLYELSFDDTYDGDAQAFYNSLSQNPVGGCSAVRKGQKIGRHYDWKYSEAPEFVVRVSAADGRHASVGVASVGSLLTEQMVMSGEYQSLYRVLPGMTLDGINDAHLVCEINVIPRDPSKDPEYDETEGRTMHPLAVVRYALDHFATALEAAQYISAHYYIPENSADSYHWSVSDPSASYVIEDGTYSLCEDATPILTNHRVITTDIYGSGYTRDGLLARSGTLEEILPQVAFTNAYADGWPWPDEFAGQEDEQGKIPYDATSRLEAWADEHITPLLDPVTRKPAARGNGCWQTVHSSIYNLTKGTLSIAVQEDFAHRFVFAVGGAKVELDGEVTEDSENGVKSSGIWSFVKGIIENLTLGWDKITGKPTTFPPTAHGHSADVITGLAQVATTGSYNSLTDKPSIPTVPTKLSEFQNDSGFITDTDAATVVKLTNRNETMADILARLTLAKTEGRYPFFDPSSFAVNPVVKLVSIDINMTDGSVRIQDVATGRIFIGSYVAAETIGDVLSRMVKRYCDILVTATRKDGGTVSDVNVYLYEGTDDTGRLVETKAYSGSPVTFRFVEGEPYFIKMDNITGLFNPTTASGIANVVNEVGIIYGDADHITTFEDIKMALVALGTVEAAKEKLIGKVIADTWVDLDGSGSGDATPSQDAAGHPIWLDPMICTNVEMAEGADGNQHLTAIMMRQYATVKTVQFDPRNHDEATEEVAQAGITYYGATSAAPTSTSAITVLSLSPGDPIPYSSYAKVYRNSVNDSTKYVVASGYNRYQYSSWRQYLTASKTAGKGTWWTKQRVGQVPPSNGDYDIHPYQAGCSDALLAAIKPIKRTVSANTVTDGGGTYQICDSLWLPANVEMFGTSTETEGSKQEEYWHFISGDSTKTPSTSEWTPRIQNTVAGKSSADTVRLRSANASTSYKVYLVYTSGGIPSVGAYTASAGVPACAIY